MKCSTRVRGEMVCESRVQKKRKKKKREKKRGHPDLNRGPLDLQSNALPLSYTPFA